MMLRTSLVALRACLIWLLIVAVESIHGILRTTLITPRFGDFVARQISVFTGSLLILIIAYFSVRWIGADSTPGLLAVGFSWLTLTVTFELCFGHFALGRRWENLASDYKI